MPKDKSFLPWLEASTLLASIVVAAIATSAISIYQISELDIKVDKLVEAVSSLTSGQAVAKNEIQTLKHNNERTQMIFIKFSDSVDKLAIAVAKLEVKSDASER